MRSRIFYLICLTVIFAFSGQHYAYSWTPLPVANDPLVRMPGTQPHQGVNLQEPTGCINCHGEKPTDLAGNIAVPGYFWSGSMMAQSARDPIFLAAMTVGIQDSIWALGNANGADLCLRCHFPEGWLGGRSDPPNASLMTGSDFDGVHCDACHRMWDPFFEATYSGAREGSDWAGYWDEAGNTGPGSGTRSQLGADLTRLEDRKLTPFVRLFSGGEFFAANLVRYLTYTENSGGQYFIDTDNSFTRKRASFADTVPDHTVLYSRNHKSKYFCASCHDVSNPIIANGGTSGLADLSGGTALITEQYAAARYGHVERTFSEFILSAYGQQGGAATNPEFQAQGAAAVSSAAMCQDCHMRDVTGKGCTEVRAPLRPDQSTEHPKSGAPLHDFQGGNLWMTQILGSLDDHFPATFDSVNLALLSQGPQTLTLNLAAGISPTDNGDALLDAAERARQQLLLAATIKNLAFNSGTGNLSFRIQNNTGHKLISGFPEGRRMFVNIKAYDNNNILLFEANPYDATAGTLRGLAHPSSPPLGLNEAYLEELVYEAHPQSSLTGEDETFHFILATGIYKDNRIPPKGFNISQAAARLSVPVWHGVVSPDYFNAAEYAGGYDGVTLNGIIPPGASRVDVTLNYQGTSREYIEFLRDEINGDADTLASPTLSGEPEAYIAQTDPFFAGLKAWGNTIWDLWYHNHGLDGLGVQVPGIVPFEMTRATTASLNPAPPVAAADAFTAIATFPLTITAPGVLANDTDINADPLTAILVSGPTDPNAAVALNSDGSFTYTYGATVAAPVVSTFQYKANDGVSDSNTVTVTITVNPGTPPATLTLLTPNGGEVLFAGEPHTITWNGPAGAAYYRLHYSLDNGVTWNIIAGAERLSATTRMFTWPVVIPLNNRNNGRIRVSAFNAGNVVISRDASDSPFTVEVIKVTQPTLGGEVLTSGQPFAIKWRINTTRRNIARMRVEVTTDNGLTWRLINVLTATNSFAPATLSGNEWTLNGVVPTVNTLRSRCKARVTLRDAGGNIIGSDVSDQFFIIQPL